MTVARRYQRRRLVGWIVASLLVGYAASVTPPSEARYDRAKASRSCGSVSLYGQDFGVRPFGAIGCETARALVDRRCSIRPKRKWSCFSFQGSDPFIEWFLSKQLFDKRWRRGVYLERYPCEDAVLSPSPFQRDSSRFPSRAQMIGDDIIRCELLAGADRATVEAAIGAPDRGRANSRYWDYYAGLERGSIFQIDPEYLSLRFSAAGRVTGASYYQD